MFRPLVVVSGLILSAVLALAQVDPNKLPTVTTGGNTNPETISDINAQLVWLLAATAPVENVSEDELAWTAFASLLTRVTVFGMLNPEGGQKLESILSKFRGEHDSLAKDYNAKIPSVAREDVWMEYRDFRVKVNDLVAGTIRTLNSTFPDNASALHSAIQNVRNNVSISTYKSSTNPDYADNPRTAATGFAYIQGAVGGPAIDPDGKATYYITIVVVGMVPGCPGKPFPTATIDGKVVEGPKLSPLQYMNFERTLMTRAERPYYVIGVQCEVSQPR